MQGRFIITNIFLLYGNIKQATKIREGCGTNNIIR